MEEHLIEHLEEALPIMQSFVGGETPACGLILGSGLGAYAEQIEAAQILPFSAVPHMKTSTAAGHVGRFVLGYVAQRRVLCMQGRLHGYEGYSPAEVAFPVWLMARLGIDTLITANAAGAINPEYAPGDICLMTDHINLTGRNPLTGIEANQLAPRFVPMHQAYDLCLRKSAQQCAEAAGIVAHEGVYVGFAGPSFETPAEILAFAALGADTVAMSLIEEVIAARHSGMRVLGLSLITNMAAGIQNAAPSDEEVLEVAHDRLGDMSQFFNALIECLPS